MNRGSKDNNGYERPSWYTPEWPKDCQYNSPGCELTELETSEHQTDIHRDMLRTGARWKEAMAYGTTAIRLSFSSVSDEDIKEIVKKLKGNEDVTEIDLSHNKIK